MRLSIASLLMIALSIMTVNAQPESTVITLDNGMEVLLIENHSSPVIASVVVVRAGLRHETVELNGATHFLEHLLFNGTETRTQKQLYDQMDFLGGYNNAMTAHDHTTFMILLEKSNFEKGLDIQADMLFHSVLPPDKFEKEKGIVIEEIGKDEDRESYRVERFFDQVTYKGTPYQWPILGSRQSIRNLTRDRVWGYYKTYYVPNNMVALIMGDFQTPEMIQIIQRVFGSEPPGTLPEEKQFSWQPLIRKPGQPSVYPGRPLQMRYEEKARGPKDVEDFVYSTHGAAQNHYLRLSFPAVQRSNQRYFAFLVMTQILEDYLQALTAEPELGVTSVSVDYFDGIDLPRLNIDLTLALDADWHVAWEVLRSEISRFVDQGINEELVQAAVTSMRAEDVFNAERPHFYGMLKSADLARQGPYFLLDYLDRLSAVTCEDVQHVSGYLSRSRPAIVAVYQAIGQEETGAITRQETRTVRKQLPNGLLALVREDHDSPIFAAHFLFKHRSAYESALGGQPGMVDFLHHILKYGPQGMERDAFQTQLQSYGTRVKFYDMAFIPYDDYYTTPEFSYIRVEALDENYPPVLELVAKTVFEPSITPEVVESVRAQMMGLAGREQASVSQSGRSLFRQLLYGDSPLAGSIVGSPQDIAAFTVDDLQRFGHQYFSPQNLILTVVTSHDADSVMAGIESIFGSWSSSANLPAVSGGPSLPGAISIPRPDELPKREEQEGGKEQSYLAMGYIFNLDDPADRAPLAIANAILSERLQFQLREKEGLAYSLGSSVDFHDGWGVWSASMGTGPQNLKRAEQGIIQEIRRAAKGKFSDADVQKARNAYMGRLAMRTLTRINQAYLMGWGEFQGEGSDRHQSWIQELRQVTTDDVKRAARRYLKTDALTTAILR